MPPGTSIRLLLVDGLLVGVGVTDGEADGVADADGELLGVADGEPDGNGDLEPEADGDGCTAPPTALPFWQVKTYSIAFAGTTNGGGGGGGVVIAAVGGALTGAVGALVDRVERGLCIGALAGLVSTGAVVIAETTAGLLTGRDGAGVELALGCGPCALSRSWVPLTSRPTCSTAVKVTAVISTHESTQPKARVSGRPNHTRPPSLARRRGGSLAASSCADGQPSGPLSCATSPFSARRGGCGVKRLSKPLGGLRPARCRSGCQIE